jgi:hypothetical protein
MLGDAQDVEIGAVVEDGAASGEYRGNEDGGAGRVLGTLPRRDL